MYRVRKDIINSNKYLGHAKLKVVSISGYGPDASRGSGLKILIDMRKLSIIGLDIEVSTVNRGNRMPLAHDPIIGIVTSNGG